MKELPDSILTTIFSLDMTKYLAYTLFIDLIRRWIKKRKLTKEETEKELTKAFFDTNYKN